VTITVATLQAKLTADASDLMSGLSSAGDAIASTATKIASLGAMAAGGALAGITALGAAGVAAWSDMDAAADTLMQTTGATGAALDAMTTSVTNLKTGTAGVGVSMADIGTAMGDIAARTGATGPALEQLTGTLLQLQAVQGEGAVSATDFGRAMNSWGVPAEQGSALLDQMFAASQRTGITTAQLSQTLQASGGALREMGFSAGQSITMLSQLSAAGIDSSTVMTGMRSAMGSFIENGQTMEDGLAGTVSAIQEATNQTEGLAIAVGVFGARAGPAMADAIRSGTFSLEAFAAEMGNTEGAIQSAAEGAMDFPDRMEMAMSRVTTALVPVGQAVMDLADAAMPALLAGADLAAGGIAAFASAMSTVGAVASAIAGYLSDVDMEAETLEATLSGLVGTGAANALTDIAVAALDFGNALSNLASGNIDSFVSSLASGIANVGRAFGLGEETAQQFALNLQSGLQTAVSVATGLFEGLKTVVAAVAPAFANLASAVGSVLAQQFANLQAVLGAVLPLFTQAQAGGGSLAATIGGVLAGALNTVASFLTGTVVPALANLGTWLAANLPGAIQTLAGFWTGTLLPAIQVVAGWVTGTLFPLLGQLVTWLADNVPVALAALANFWTGTLWPAIQAVASWVTGTLFPLFAQLAVWLGTTLGQALSQLSAFWQQHGDTILSIAQTTWDTIQSVIDSVLGTISGLMDAFQSAREGDWRAFGEKLRELWDAAWQAMVNIVSTVGALVVSAISTLLSNARTEFMAIDWPQLGRDMMQGVANGISAGASFIADAARNAAQAALDAAKGFLGISSPSTVAFDELGVPIVQGIAGGIESGAPLIASALRGILSILPQVASAMRGFSESLRGVNMERASQGIASFALTLGGLVDVLEQFDKLKGANLSSGTRNGIANLMIFVHDVIMAAGPARGDIGTDIPGPFRRLAESIGSLLEALTSLSGLLKLTDDVAKTLKASTMTGLREFLVWFTGVAVTLVGDAARATVGVEKLNTAGLKPLNDALGPVAGIVSQTGTLVKGLVEAMAFDWGDFSFGGARAALIGLIQGSLYLVQDLGRFNAQIAALKVELGPLGAVVQDASSLATGAFGLVKALVDAFAFDWSKVNFGDLRSILNGLVTGALYLTQDLGQFTARIAALRVTLGPLTTILQDTTSIAGQTFTLVKLLVEAMAFKWASIDFGDARAVLHGLIEIALFFTEDLDILTAGLSELNVNLAPLNTVASDLLSTARTTFDLVKLALEALAFDWDAVDLAGGVRAMLIGLLDIGMGLAETANGVIGTWSIEVKPALTNLGRVLAGSLDALGSTLDIVDAMSGRGGLAGLPISDLVTSPGDPNTPLQRRLMSLLAIGKQLAEAANMVIGSWTIEVKPALANLGRVLGDALDGLGATLDIVDAIAGRGGLAGLPISDLVTSPGDPNTPLQRRIMSLIAIGKQMAEAANTAIGSWTIEVKPALTNLGRVLGDALSVISDTLDVAELIAKPPTLPVLGDGPGSIRAWLQSLPIWAGEVAIAVGASLTAFNITFPLLDRLQTEADRAAGIIGVALDMIEKLAKPPVLPDLNQGGLRAWLQSLARWVGEVTIAVGASLTAFNITFPALERLGTEADRASGVIGTALDLAEKLVKPPALPDLGFGAGSIRAWLNRLPIWLGEVAIAVGASLTAFGVSYPLLDRLGTEADRASGVVGAALDLIEKLSKPPAFPDLNAGGLRQWLNRLPIWLGEVTIAVGATLTTFGVTYPLLDRLKTEADRAVGLIGVGLEAIEKLTNPPDLPPLGSGAGSLRQYLIDLTQWMIGVATEVGRQAAGSGITAAWEQAAATLSNTFGSAADAVMKYIDLVQALGEKLPLTVAGGPNPFGSWWGGTSPNPMLDPAHVAERVKPLIEGIKAIARAMAQAAADLATEGVNVGAGNQLGQNLSGMVDGVLSMVDALDKLSGIRVGGQGLQNLRDLMFQVFGIIAGQAGQAAQVQAVVNAIDAALGGLATLAGAQGYTAGTNWVDGFVNAVNAGMGQLGGAIPTTAPGGGGGVAATTIINNYNNNKTVNINVVNTNADASSASNAGIVNAVLYA
jgi:phage-related protein